MLNAGQDRIDMDLLNNFINVECSCPGINYIETCMDYKFGKISECQSLPLYTCAVRHVRCSSDVSIIVCKQTGISSATNFLTEIYESLNKTLDLATKQQWIDCIKESSAPGGELILPIVFSENASPRWGKNASWEDLSLTYGIERSVLSIEPGG